jgi:hypothetical protein
MSYSIKFDKVAYAVGLGICDSTLNAKNCLDREEKKILYWSHNECWNGKDY